MYGADLVSYTLLITAGLLLAGALCHLFWQTAVIIALYYTNQTLGGGYHASTHGRYFPVYSFICALADQSGVSAQTRLKYNSSNVSMASRGTSHHC